MLLTPANLSAMFTAFSLQYQAGYGSAEIFWRLISTLVPSATETMTYAWMEKIPKMREWVGPKVIQNVVARGPRVVINKSFEETLGVQKHKIQDDTYGLFAPLASALGEQAAKWPDDVVGDKILENPVAFDGKAFFATDHPVNMDDGAAGTYSNRMTATALNLTNFQSAKQRMRTFKGADGRPIGSRGTLLIVPPSLEGIGRTILQSQYYPKLADGGALGNGDVAMVENVWKGTAELLVIDELEAEPGNWYLFDTRKPIKPIIFQLREAPVFTYLMNPDHPNVFFNKEFIMGVEARGAADVTLPFLALKGEA